MTDQIKDKALSHLSGEPVAYAVFDGKEPIYSASYAQACHEHINDAINEFDIDGADKWKVIPLYAAHPDRDAIIEQLAELRLLLERIKELDKQNVEFLDALRDAGHRLVTGGDNVNNHVATLKIIDNALASSQGQKGESK